MNPRCSMWQVVFLEASALCRFQRVKSQGLRSPLCPSKIYHLPRGQRHSFCARACACSSSTGLPHEQQRYLRVRGPQSWRLPAAAGKPCSCCGPDVFLQRSRSSTATVVPTSPEMYGRCSISITITKLALRLGTWWYAPVALCSNL